MEQPWRLGEDGEVYDLEVILPTFTGGNSAAVEHWLGVPLPQGQFPEEFDVRLFPESGGLLCWGGDGRGAVYYWDTGAPDPDCMEGRRRRATRRRLGSR